MIRALPLVLLATPGCVELPDIISASDTGTPDTGATGESGTDGRDCEADFTLGFPTADDATLDGCSEVTLDATFEFDPDDPPEMRGYTVTFDAATEAGFECAVTIEQIGVCGGGYYGVGADDTTGAQPVVVRVDTSDCTGVEDDWEGEFTAVEGWVRLAEVDGGSVAGDFTGEPLATTLVGEVVVELPQGLTLSGFFRLTEPVVATDAEESACYGSSGDEDGDGYKDERFGGTDCDDSDPNLNTGDTWWTDADADGYGAQSGDVFACEQPANTVDNDLDCDDGDRWINPDGLEICDDVDQDCDGQVDEGASDTSTWYRDADDDGYGAQSGASLEACDPPSGYAATRGDCDDDDPGVNPDATEIAGNDVDEDCDGQTSSDGIYAVQDGTRTAGDVVTLTGVIVTATSEYGFWVQEPAGGEYSGLWIYVGSGWEDTYSTVAEGREVTVTGEINEYSGLTELDFSLGGGSVSVTGSPGLPSAEVLTLTELQGSASEPWEGVLVEVRGVEVEDPDLGYGEWSVTDGSATILVDDAMTEPSTLRAGTTFTAITGLWHYSYGDYKLEPRGSGDFSGYSF